MTSKKKSTKVSVSSARAKRAATNREGAKPHRPDAELDFSDIPELSDAQLKRARRVKPLSQHVVSK